MTQHAEPHPHAGKTVPVALRIPRSEPRYADLRIEDWWDRIAGQSWMECDGNMAALNYGLRAGLIGLPHDNDVVYGKIASQGLLVHASELRLS